MQYYCTLKLLINHSRINCRIYNINAELIAKFFFCNIINTHFYFKTSVTAAVASNNMCHVLVHRRPPADLGYSQLLRARSPSWYAALLRALHYFSNGVVTWISMRMYLLIRSCPGPAVNITYSRINSKMIILFEIYIFTTFFEIYFYNYIRDLIPQSYSRFNSTIIFEIAFEF